MTSRAAVGTAFAERPSGWRTKEFFTMSNQSVSLIPRMLRPEWLGQTVASLCWIASVFLYGIEEAADVFQLVAASAWLVANIAGVCSAGPNRDEKA